MTYVPREKEYAVSRQHGRPSPRPQGGAEGVGPGPGAGRMDLCGVHSHGAQLLPALVRNIRRGITSPDTRIEVLVGAYCTQAAEAERFVYEVCTFSASSVRIDRE